MNKDEKQSFAGLLIGAGIIGGISLLFIEPKYVRGFFPNPSVEYWNPTFLTVGIGSAILFILGVLLSASK